MTETRTGVARIVLVAIVALLAAFATGRSVEAAGLGSEAAYRQGLLACAIVEEAVEHGLNPREVIPGTQHACRRFEGFLRYPIPGR